jgi:hypothetical protein
MTRALWAPNSNSNNNKAPNLFFFPSRSFSVPKPKARKRRVRFGGVSVVPVPKSDPGRGLHPNYKARVSRQRGLAAHGLAVPPVLMNLLYGNGSNNSVGSKGQYTAEMAQRNKWRTKHKGKLWYARASGSNKVHFLPAFSTSANERQAVQKMMADTLRKRLKAVARANETRLRN